MFNKILFTALFCLSLGAVNHIQAQKIALGAGIGMAKLTGELGEGGSFGLNYFLEGKYFLTDQFNVGLEVNSSGIAFGNEGSVLGVAAYGSREFLAKAEYFFLDSKVTPYAGLGLGLSRISTPEQTYTINSETTTIPSESKVNLGISPRVGLMLGGFGIEFTYNLAGKTPISEFSNVTASDKTFNYYTVVLKYAFSFDL